jgi:hypothetical protein
MSDLSNDTKKHTTKSRETIPLNTNFAYCPNAGGVNPQCHVSSRVFSGLFGNGPAGAKKNGEKAKTGKYLL